MDYHRIVGVAGYSGEKAEYIIRKLESRNVTKEGFLNLHGYFPRMNQLAGFELHELGLALYGAAVEIEKPLPVTKSKKTAKTAVEENENGDN